MNIAKRTCLIVLLLAWRSALGNSTATSPELVRVAPAAIEIGLLFRVPPIRIDGLVPAGSEVIVVVRGPQQQETFNKKVRAGPIWVSSGKVHFSGAPFLFLSFSSAPTVSVTAGDRLCEELSPAAIAKRLQVRMEGPPADENLMREHYLKLKTQAGVYQLHNGSVTIDRHGPSEHFFSLTFEWPRKAGAGLYTISVFRVVNGQAVRIAEQALPVRQTGLAALLFTLATGKPATYGILTIVLAALGGFGIDFLAAKIFGTEPRGTH